MHENILHPHALKHWSPKDMRDILKSPGLFLFWQTWSNFQLGFILFYFPLLSLPCLNFFSVYPGDVSFGLSDALHYANPIDFLPHWNLPPQPCLTSFLHYSWLYAGPWSFSGTGQEFPCFCYCLILPISHSHFLLFCNAFSYRLPPSIQVLSNNLCQEFMKAYICTH